MYFVECSSATRPPRILSLIDPTRNLIRPFLFSLETFPGFFLLASHYYYYFFLFLFSLLRVNGAVEIFAVLVHFSDSCHCPIVRLRSADRDCKSSR